MNIFEELNQKGMVKRVAEEKLDNDIKLVKEITVPIVWTSLAALL